ncbi:MAG: hypothetical protein WDN72_10710 [Alphaproteobacteria bacterium]
MEELLAEPIVRLVMQRDGVRARDMRTTIDRVQQDRRQGHPAVL